MAVSISGPAVLSIAAGIGTLLLVRYCWSFRDQPGALLLIGVLVSGAFWALTYGLALLVFSPVIRPLFEIPLWLSKVSLPVLTLLFALEYTGRGHLVRSRWTWLLVLLAGGQYLLYASTPFSGLMWSDYRIEPVLGAAAVYYNPSSLLLGFNAVSYLLILVALLLLLDALVSYGALYRRQILVLLCAFGLPAVVNVVRFSEVVLPAELDLTPISFLVTGLLGTYALSLGEVLKFPPAVERIANQVAIDDLETAILIVNDDGQIINLNTAAVEMLGVDEATALRCPLAEFVDADIPLEAGELTVSSPTGGGYEYQVAVSPLADASGTTVGYTITFQDITAERLRQQRLEVLNRVLRHNLRNDLSTVNMYADLLEEAPREHRDYATRIREAANELIDIGAKAGEIEEVLTTHRHHQRTDELSTAVDAAVEEARAAHPDCEFAYELRSVDPGVENPVVTAVLSELLANGAEHNDADEPRVKLVAEEPRDDTYAVDIYVRDNGPGIPDHEVKPLEEGTETALEHGSGLGLWLVKWGVTLVDGEVEFLGTESGGNEVLVRLPNAVTAE